MPWKTIALTAFFFIMQGALVIADLDFGETLGYEALVLAIAAFFLSLEHSTKIEGVAGELEDVARKLERVADDQLVSVTKKLEGVAHAIPTRGIGVFPDYLGEVAGLVEQATSSIVILCDTPAHGAFSNTEAFKRYWDQLRYKMVDSNVEVKCTFFDASGRKELHYAQIEDDRETWDEWKERNRENCEAFNTLASECHLPRTNNGSPLETWADKPDTYVESMMAINDQVLKTFDHGLSVEQLEFDNPLQDGPTVYFWRRDGDKEAVFVIVPVRGIGVKDLAGFHTRDPVLIRALSSVYDHREGGG